VEARTAAVSATLQNVLIGSDTNITTGSDSYASDGVIDNITWSMGSVINPNAITSNVGTIKFKLLFTAIDLVFSSLDHLNHLIFKLFF